MAARCRIIQERRALTSACRAASQQRQGLAKTAAAQDFQHRRR